MGRFLTQMQKFYYCPPSNHLWTVEIKSHGDTTKNGTYSNIKNLYNHIMTVNNAYSKVIRSDWKIDLGNTKETSGCTIEEFLNGFSSLGNLFLAQNIKVTSNKIQDSGSIYNDFSNHGGFLTQPKVIMGRVQNPLQCTINFNVSNWSISDILLDPWIAALAQRGLIKDGDIDLTSDIYLTFYAASAPSVNTEEKYVAKEWVLQKQIILYGAYPTDRDDVADVTYDFDKAGIYKTAVATFHFDDYSIRYFI